MVLFRVPRAFQVPKEILEKKVRVVGVQEKNCFNHQVHQVTQVTVAHRENLVLLEMMVPLVTLEPQESRVRQVCLDLR